MNNNIVTPRKAMNSKIQNQMEAVFKTIQYKERSNQKSQKRKIILKEKV